MTFRRFKRSHPNLEQSLCTDYCELVKLTLQLADEIYHREHLKLAYNFYEQEVGEINDIVKKSRAKIKDLLINDHFSDSDDSDSDRVEPKHSIACTFGDYAFSERSE